MAKDNEAPVHDGLPQVLSIDSMANGAMYEMFDEALRQLATNVADPNTEPTQKRSITITVEASPYKDRSGAAYKVKVSTKLAGMRPAESSMYFARRGGQCLAFGRNTKQDEIQFEMPSTDPAPKPKAN